jgi:cell division protein ZapA
MSDAMAQVTVMIAGRSYRMACGDGDEPRLERLAAQLDGKIEELRGAFGEIGDMRLHVMAALTIADELDETKERLAAIEGELAALKQRFEAGEERAQASEIYMAETLTRTAERIERLAKSLNPSAPVVLNPSPRGEGGAGAGRP